MKTSQTHKEIAERLGVLLTPYVCRNPAFSSRAGLIFENFLMDLLKRRVQDQILIRQQISIFGWDIDDTFSILVIDGQKQSQDKQQIYYAQAASILRFRGGNGRDKHLFLQEDVGLYGILEASLERHDALELCHPDRPVSL